MPETYLNLAAILSLLNIHDIKCKIATEFKLLNILLGISVCSNHELASNEASSHVNHDSYRNLQLKFVIAIFKGYGAKFACAFCEGVSTLTSGNLRTFGLLKQRYRDLCKGCLGDDLTPDYKERIEHFKRTYELLVEFAHDVHPDVTFNVPWKVHALVCHLPQFLEKYQTGMSCFAEQCVESCHADYKKTEKRFLVNEEHEDHTKRLKRSMAEFNSRRM